jgi:predicted nucleic acid-binding Zn ribbon protein
MPSPRDERGPVLTTVQFTCSDCAQTIEVNDEMRETILTMGCPVCTTGASESDFSADSDEA